jgi:DNA-binding transcriptional regulator YhcF (GntR family)
MRPSDSPLWEVGGTEGRREDGGTQPPDKADGLRQALRSVAIKNQREQPRVFYSLREVAKRFRVPVSTVAKIYHDMVQDGLLSRVRGSRTVLNGLRNNRRLSVRGFVGLPALISNFVAIQEYRTFFISLRRELWSRGFATTMFFSTQRSG